MEKMMRRTHHHRFEYMAAFLLASALVFTAPHHGTDAFTAPSSTTRAVHVQQRQTSWRRSGQQTVNLAATNKNGDDDHIQVNDRNNPFFADLTLRPLFTAATSAFLATSLLFSNPLLPPPDAQAAASSAMTTNKPISTQTATSIDIDLRSLPSLTRKVIVNREQLTNYLIESIKSFKPILDLLSESDTVTVKPPKDVKGAINQALTKGDAQFIVNNQPVDIRVESVPGVIVVRVINPNIPRLPFLRDGTAALQFVDDIVDVAPGELEKAAEEIQAVEKFLMWGAPQKAPLQYKGSSLDYFLSSKFLWNGEVVRLGSLGEVTNSEVVFLGVTLGVTGAYSASYAYYVSLKEEAEREADEKKAQVAAKKKAKAVAEKKKKDAQEKKKAEAVVAEEKVKVEEKEAKIAEVESEYSKAAAGKAEEEEGATTAAEDAAPVKARKRDAIKNIFRRGNNKQ